MSELSPLDPETRAALDAERRRDDPSAARLSRARHLLDLRVAGAPATVDPAAGVRPTPSGAPPWSNGSVAAVAGLSGIVLGAVVTFAVMRTTTQAPVPPPPSPSATNAVSVAPPPVVATSATTFAPAVPVAPVPRRSADVPSSGASAAAVLTEERAVLDEARASLRDNDAARALVLTARHEKNFAHGQLVEEREAIAIRALVGLGRREEARVRAERFHAKFPGSALGRAIDAALDAR